MVWVLLSLAGFAAPDQDTEAFVAPCYVEFDGSVPKPGSVDVPTDLLPRVRLFGDVCAGQQATLVLQEVDGATQTLSATVDDDDWLRFSDATVKPLTSYTATFVMESSNELRLDFTTSDQLAAAPSPPDLTVVDLATTRTTRGGSVTGSLAFLAAFDDPLNLSNVAISVDTKPLAEFPGAAGSAGDRYGWVDFDHPDEVCVNAVTVSASGEQSGTTTVCGPPEHRKETPGCGCATSQPVAGWPLAMLVCAMFFRRRR